MSEQTKRRYRNAEKWREGRGEDRIIPGRGIWERTGNVRKGKEKTGKRHAGNWGGNLKHLETLLGKP